MPEVDPDQLRGVTVGPHRKNGGTGAGPVEDGPQNAGQQQGDGQTAQADVGDDDAPEMQPAAGIRGSHGTEIAGEDQQQQADDHEVDTEGQQKGEEERRPDDPVDDPSLQRVADHEKCQRVDRQAQEGIDVQAGEEIPGDVGAHDYQRSVRQVDDIQDPPHEAESEGDRDIDPTQQKTEDNLLGELAHELSLTGRTAGLARAPGRRRILWLPIGDACGKDGVVGAMLNLLHHHRLIDVDAAAVELDLAEERHDVQRGKRIAHLRRVTFLAVT